MLDTDGNLVTSVSKIEKITLDVYASGLKKRPMTENLSNPKNQKENLYNLRLELAKRNKSPAWTMEDLEKVLRDLKMNKSRDPMG